MTLQFKGRDGWRDIARCKDEKEAIKSIHEFIDQCNASRPPGQKIFVSYYTRIWDVDGYRYYDVGSWTELFRLKLEE